MGVHRVLMDGSLLTPPHPGPLPRRGEGMAPLTLALSHGGVRGQISILRVVPVFGGPVFYGSGDF